MTRLRALCLLIAVALTLALAGCSRNEDLPTGTDDAGRPVDPALLAFLSRARSAHHIADGAEEKDDLGRAVEVLRGLVADRGLSMVYITHDLASVPTICHRLAVMYLGRIVETGPTLDLLRAPSHPYTHALVSAIPSPDPGRQRMAVPISGGVHDAVHLPKGCRFADRCPIAGDICRRVDPALEDRGEGRAVACHKPDEARGLAPGAAVPA